MVHIFRCSNLILGEDSDYVAVITCHFNIFVLNFLTGDPVSNRTNLNPIGVRTMLGHIVLMAELTKWSVGSICSLEQEGLKACRDVCTVFGHGVLGLWDVNIRYRQLL